MSASRGGWSGAAASGPAHFSNPDADRYAWRDLLGVGGMGAVHAVYDAKLGREVAMKILEVAAGEGLQRRAEREARITARLEHPAIVPVHDAGRTADGRSFYTMRVVRGRSLAERLRETRAAERLDLLRPFLAACEAMAYAHSRGVTHRDLKPENLMVGAFGEVQIVDWGLACALGEPDPWSGAPTGTIGYASPEQLRGEAATPSADVYGLGAILRDIVGGVDGVPEDLEAIREKACAPSPRDRYPDAKALAADVARFIDGRRVAAHSYSSWTLAARFLRVYRRWITGSLVAVAGAALLAGLAFERVRHSRQQAEDARLHTRAALEERSAALATAREEQAVAALAGGELAEAELLALAALEHGPSPLARGVLMRVHAGPRWRAERFRPACDGGHVHHGRAAHLCLDGARLRFFTGGDRRWTITVGDVAEMAIGADRIALRGADGVLLLDRSTGRQVGTVAAGYRPSALRVSPWGERLGAVIGPAVYVDGEGGTTRVAPCTPSAAIALTLGDRHVAGTCADGTLAMVDDRGVGRRLALPLAEPFALAFSAGDRRLAVGTLDGAVLLVDPVSGATEGPWALADRPVAALGWLTGGALLVVTDDGSARVVDSGGRTRLRLPRRLEPAVDRGTLIASDGRDRWTWEPPETGPAATLQAPSGLSSAAFGSGWTALGRGDGRVSVHRPDGALLWEPELSEEVVKRVAVDGDGLLGAAVAGEPSLFALDVATRTVRSVDAPAHRRLVGLREGFLGARYDDALTRWRRVATPVPGPQAIDIDRDPARRVVAVLRRDGAVDRWEDGRIERLARVPFAVAVAVGPEGSLAVARPRGLRFEDAAGVREWESPAPVLDVAIAPDGRTLAAGTRRGDLLVWDREGRLLAHARDATERVSWVGYAPDGRLAAASWDGALRFYEPRTLGRSTEALRRAAREAWALELSE